MLSNGFFMMKKYLGYIFLLSSFPCFAEELSSSVVLQEESGNEEVEKKEDSSEPSFELVLDQTPHDLLATDKESECGRASRPMRITARHIESNGIGYSEGYTTVEGFFAPTRLWDQNWLPFADLRGHIF